MSKQLLQVVGLLGLGAGLMFAGCQRAVQVEAAQLCGGFTPMRQVSAEEAALFQQATRGTAAEGLVPEAVATQVVAGTNYRFRARQADGARFEVRIFEPLPCHGAMPTLEALEVQP